VAKGADVQKEAPRAAAAPLAGARAEVQTGWRATVAAVAFTQFAAKFGTAFVTPFIPVFLALQLGVHDPRQLALWTGLIAGATGGGVALASIFWGALADRYGRKPMLVRAVLAGSVVMALTTIVQSPLQLLGARFIFGSTGATVASANALVSAETPRDQVGWGLGVVASAMALGQAIGPLVGGAMSVAFGIRWSILLGSGIMLVPVLPLVRYVKERSQPVVERKLSIAAAVRSIDRPSTRTLTALILSQGLTQFAYFSVQQLAAVRLIELQPHHPAVATGFAFSALGLATGISAIGYSRVAGWVGFRWLAIVGSVLLGLSMVVVSRTTGLPLFIVSMGLMGLVYGSLNPSLASMVGLEAPTAIKATVFGVSASVAAIGQTIGPAASGGVSAIFGVPVGLEFAAAFLVLVAALLVLLAREPRIAVA
jgi:DHA1 family multidrug resistance protein-like MFS transporter